MDQYTNEPSYKVGFNILEEIVTADEDESLYDNAQGFNNFGAPGADRLKITATLSKKAIDDTDSDNFVQITQIRDGDILNTPTNQIIIIFRIVLLKQDTMNLAITTSCHLMLM